MWIWDKREDVEGKVKQYMDMKKFPEIKGYNFSGKFDFRKFCDSFLGMGFQGSNLGIAMDIFAKMLKEKEAGLKIFLSMTGNMISSGNREIITFLVKNKIIDGITTTAAGLEEDVIKCIKPFHLASFDIKGQFLLDECIGRIGNILVPADRYLYFERFLNELFPVFLTRQNNGRALCTHEIAKEMGLLVGNHELTKENKEESFLYWAAKNDIPVYCPGITDGAIGDISTFFAKKHPEFVIDVVKDNTVLTRQLMDCDRAGSIILGGGISKHFLLNAAIFREGFDYSIYMTTASGFDGSDSGGNQEEAISWAKIRPEALRVKVRAEATLVFPFLVASAFADIDKN